MSSASPNCIVHTTDTQLSQRLEGIIHRHADVLVSSKVSEMLAMVGRCGQTVIFLDALNGDLFEAMLSLQDKYYDCPVIVIGEDASGPILALDGNYVFTVVSPEASNRAILRVFSVAQQQLERLDEYRIKVAALEDQLKWQAMSTPRPGEVIRGLLLAFAGFRKSDELLERFMEWIQQHYDVAEGGIFLLQPGGEEFRVNVSINDPSGMQVAYKACHPFVHHLESSRVVIHESTLDRLPLAVRAVCEQALRNCRAEAIFPMKIASGVIGWIYVGPGFLKELKVDDLKELNMITSCLAAFVEREEEQSARLQDAEASQGLLEQLKVAALMLDATDLEVTWMNPEGRAALNLHQRLPVALESFDPAFAGLIAAMLSGERDRETSLWSPVDSSRDYAVAMIGPSERGRGKAFILLQDITSEVLLGAEAPQPELPDSGPRANLCTKIRDPLVAIKTFIQLLPERHKEPEFCDAFVPIITGSIERLEQLIMTLERRVLESESTQEEGEEELDYALRHLLEDVFAEIGEPLEPDRVRNTRDVYLKWSGNQRRLFTQHLAHLASMDGWGRAAEACDLMLEWKDLAEMGEICLIVRKGDALAATALPRSHAAVDGLKNFLERLDGALEIDQQDHAYFLSLTFPKTCL